MLTVIHLSLGKKNSKHLKYTHHEEIFEEVEKFSKTEGNIGIGRNFFSFNSIRNELEQLPSMSLNFSHYLKISSWWKFYTSDALELLICSKSSEIYFANTTYYSTSMTLLRASFSRPFMCISMSTSKHL